MGTLACWRESSTAKGLVQLEDEIYFFLKKEEEK